MTKRIHIDISDKLYNLIWNIAEEEDTTFETIAGYYLLLGIESEVKPEIFQEIVSDDELSPF